MISPEQNDTGFFQLRYFQCAQRSFCVVLMQPIEMPPPSGALPQLESVRAMLRDKRLDEATQQFLALPQLQEDPSGHRVARLYLEHVLRDLYAAGLYDIQVLLSFLEGLPKWRWTLDGCLVLHQVDEVVRAPCASDAATAAVPTLPLAFFLHKLMQHLEGAMRVRAESYWYEWVSPTIRAVVMGQALLLQSVARQELMYAAANDFCYDRDRRNAFCWRPEWTPDDLKEQWRLIPANAQKDRFYIRNVCYDEYLYAADYAKFKRDDQGQVRSRVFLWRKTDHVPGDSGQWQLVTLDRAQRNVFALYNPYQREYLYAPMSDMYDHDRRFVLTTPHRHKQPNWLEERKWQLTPVTSSLLDQGVEAFFTKDFANAVTLLTRAVDESVDRTEHVKCFAYRMVANLRLRHFDRINQDFAAIQELGGEKAAIFHGLAHLWEECAFAINDPQVKDNGEVIKQDPFAVAHQLALGEALFVQKEYAAAAGCFEEAARVACAAIASDEPQNQELTSQAAHAMVCGSKCFYALDRADEGIKQLERARRDLPLLPMAMDALVLLWMGKCKRKSKEFDPAMQYFENAMDCVVQAVGDSASVLIPTIELLKSSILLEMQIVTLLKRHTYEPLLSSYEPEPLPEESSPNKRNSADTTLQQMMDLFHCPLSLELMDDPVMTPNGNTYERQMIERHLEVNGNFDPMTRAPLAKEQLYPNRALKMLMETMLSTHRLGLLLTAAGTS